MLDSPDDQENLRAFCSFTLRGHFYPISIHSIDSWKLLWEVCWIPISSQEAGIFLHSAWIPKLQRCSPYPPTTHHNKLSILLSLPRWKDCFINRLLIVVLGLGMGWFKITLPMLSACLKRSLFVLWIMSKQVNTSIKGCFSVPPSAKVCTFGQIIKYKPLASLMVHWFQNPPDNSGNMGCPWWISHAMGQ